MVAGVARGRDRFQSPTIARDFLAMAQNTVRCIIGVKGAIGARAIIALTAPIIFMNRARIAETALKHRLALISVFSTFPDAGALLAYGPSLAGMFRQAAGHVDRILRGAKPAEIPIERPTKFELVLNAKTAKALAISIPMSLLVRADRVIE